MVLPTGASVGLPKKAQHYLLFQIDNDVAAFRKRLGLLVPHVTTTSQVQHDRTKIAAHKKAAAELGNCAGLLPLSSINIAFSHAGLLKVGLDRRSTLLKMPVLTRCLAWDSR